MSALERANGVITGPVRQPRNLNQTTRGSIHNDSVATKLGFRGGTVAGIIHHEQFAPLLLGAFGPTWFETGGISIYYLKATTHAEDVQAFAEEPPAEARDAQIGIWMEQVGGFKVLEGTASLGHPKAKTHLRERYESRRAPGETQILARIEPGEVLAETPVRLPMADQQMRRSVITESLDWYWGASPWGGPICTPVTAFRLLNDGFVVRDKIEKAVGLYGAIEVNVQKGPLFVDRDYVAQGKILAKGETPKSEYLWWECHLRDPATGDEVADLLMMYRWMKGSVELLAQV